MIQKNAALSLLEGYKMANEFISMERKKRLAQLTTKESLHEYTALCELAIESIKNEHIKGLQQKKIEFLLKRRQTFNRVKSGNS